MKTTPTDNTATKPRQHVIELFAEGPPAWLLSVPEFKMTNADIKAEVIRIGKDKEMKAKATKADMLELLPDDFEERNKVYPAAFENGVDRLMLEIASQMCGWYHHDFKPPSASERWRIEADRVERIHDTIVSHGMTKASVLASPWKVSFKGLKNLHFTLSRSDRAHLKDGKAHVTTFPDTSEAHIERLMKAKAGINPLEDKMADIVFTAHFLGKGEDSIYASSVFGTSIVSHEIKLEEISAELEALKTNLAVIADAINSPRLGEILMEVMA